MCYLLWCVPESGPSERLSVELGYFSAVEVRQTSFVCSPGWYWASCWLNCANISFQEIQLGIHSVELNVKLTDSPWVEVLQCQNPPLRLESRRPTVPQQRSKCLRPPVPSRLPWSPKAVWKRNNLHPTWEKFPVVKSLLDYFAWSCDVRIFHVVMCISWDNALF